MAIKKIVIDSRTKTTKIDASRVQLDILAFPMNEQNQREPWAELRLYVNDSLVKTFISDATGTVQESLIVSIGSLKLKDVMSHVECNIFDVLQDGWWSNNEKQWIIVKIKLDPNYITRLDEESKNDPEIVKYAIEQNGSLLRYAGENIKNDKKMVMLAMDHSPQAFNYASDVLKTDEEFVIECIKKYWTTIINYLSYYMLSRPNIKVEITNILNELKQKKEVLEKIWNKLPNDHINKYHTFNISLMLGNESLRVEQMYEQKNTHRLKSVDSTRAINYANIIIENQK